MTGYLDGITGRTIFGWAADANGDPADLIVTLNKREIGRFHTSVYRPDLQSRRKDLGFEWDLGRRTDIGDVIAITDESGQHLVGSPHKIRSAQLGRVDKVLWHISRDMKILEIGPSFNPLVPRSAGWNSFSLDHATAEELKEKYRGAQPIERIEPVDYLWRGGPIESAIPSSEHGTFDAVIASHVLEHIPDPIGFFLSCAKLLTRGEFVALILPDKRAMFDFFKPLTATSDYLAAHRERRTRHTAKTVFDNHAYNARESGSITWSKRPVSDFSFIEPDLVSAKRQFDSTTDDPAAPYVDYHFSVFTPSSFELIILELGQMGLLPFEIVRMFPTDADTCEFAVTLQRRPPKQMSSEELTRERIRLMKATAVELADHGRMVS